jgi:hypothetical protein
MPAACAKGIQETRNNRKFPHKPAVRIVVAMARSQDAARDFVA